MHAFRVIEQYDFSGRNDLVRFIKEIEAQGLYACLRIGPFIEAEWTYGYACVYVYSLSVFTPMFLYTGPFELAPS